MLLVPIKADTSHFVFNLAKPLGAGYNGVSAETCTASGLSGVTAFLVKEAKGGARETMVMGRLSGIH